MPDRADRAVDGIVRDVCAHTGFRARARALTAQTAHFSRELAEAFHARSVAQARVDPREASELAHLGLRVATHIDDQLSRVACWQARAEAEIVQGEFGAALGSLASARQCLPPGGEPRQEAELDALRASALTPLGRFVEAEAAGERALAVFEALGDDLRIVRARIALGTLAFRRDHPRAALRHYRAAAARIPPTSQGPVRAAVAMNQANALAASLRFRAARRHFDLATTLFQGAGREHTAAQVTFNAAYADFLQGAYQPALAAYRDVERVFERLDDQHHLAHLHLDRTEVLLALGLGRDAAASADAARTAFEALALPQDAAQATLLRGCAYRVEGDRAAAMRDLADAAARFDAAGVPIRGARARVHLARAALDGRDLDTADAALDAAGRVGGVPLLATAERELVRARWWLERGDPTEALHRADRTYQSIRMLGVPWLQIDAQGLIGRAHAARGDHDAAVLAYRRAIDRLEQARDGVPPDEHMAAWLSGWASLFTGIVECLVALGHDELAYEFAARAKSRALADRFQRTAPARAGGWPRRVRYLRRRLSIVYRQLFQHVEGRQPLGVRALDGKHEEALTLEAELARHCRAARAHDAAPRADAPGLADVQACLDDEEMLLEFFFTDAGLLVFRVTREGLEVEVRPHDADDLDTTLTRLQGQIALCAPVQGERARTRPDASDALTGLSQALLGEWRPSPGMTRLLVVPHGRLHGVAFHALPTGRTHLGDQVDVHVLPTTATLLRPTASTARAGGPAAVFAVPDGHAPRIAEEAEALGEILSTPDVFVGKDATWARLRAHARTAKVLHIATHGLFRRDEPMMSALRLGDAWANLHDLQDLEIRGELVVLAACESGTAVTDAADEWMGIGRAFLAAGAPCLVASLWPVDDALTAAWMSAFHAARAEGRSPGAAFRAAVQQVRRTHPHPYAWAPFFLAGRPPTPIETERRAVAPSASPTPRAAATAEEN